MKYVFKKKSLLLLIGAIDMIGYVFFAPIMFYRKLFAGKGAPEKILVVRLDQTGDVVQSIPFFEALRKKYPMAEISALVTKNNGFLLADRNCVDRVISMETSWFYGGGKQKIFDILRSARELKKEKYDAAFDLRGDIRNIFFLFLAGVKRICGYGCAGGGFMLDEKFPYNREDHEMDKNLLLIGERSGPEVKISFMPSAEDAKAAGQLSGKAKGKKIVMHPFAGADSKMWGLDKFGALSEMIAGADAAAAIFIIGGKADAQAAEMLCARVKNAVNCAGVLSLGAAVALIKNSDIFIGNDSGPQYFAAYSGVKTCVIAGYTSDYERWRPKVDPKNLIVFKKETPCGPCEQNECSEPQHRCMDEITVSEVFEKIKVWI